MGYVTDIILSLGLGEDSDPDGESTESFHLVRELNERLEQKRHAQLELVSWKIINAELFHLSSKNIILEDFLEEIWSMPWRHPEEIQVFSKGENDDLWIVHTKAGPSTLAGDAPTEGE